MKLKEAYFRQVPGSPKPTNLNHDNQVEECHFNLIKPVTKEKVARITVRKAYIRRKEFLWGHEQDAAFQEIMWSLELIKNCNST